MIQPSRESLRAVRLGITTKASTDAWVRWIGECPDWVAFMEDLAVPPEPLREALDEYYVARHSKDAERLKAALAALAALSGPHDKA